MAMFRPCHDDALRVRRHVALASLLAMIAALAIMLTLAFIGTEHSAAILSAMGVNLGIILTALTGMTGAWFHAAYQIDKRNGHAPEKESQS